MFALHVYRVFLGRYYLRTSLERESGRANTRDPMEREDQSSLILAVCRVALLGSQTPEPARGT